MIHWELKNPSPTGGWVVQRVVHTTPEGRDYAHWEAWRVEKGQTHTVGYPYVDDTFQKAQDAGPGVHKIRSEARFYEGLALLPSFKAGSVLAAGKLPATELDPDLPTANATAPFVRTFDTIP